MSRTPSAKCAPDTASDSPEAVTPDDSVLPDDSGLEVHRLLRAIADAIQSQPEQALPAPAPAATAKPAKAKAGQAAFTLRLDPERHLRLRLACAARNCSAQQLVTLALDRLLNDLPEIEQLATQLKRS